LRIARGIGGDYRGRIGEMRAGGRPQQRFATQIRCFPVLAGFNRDLRGHLMYDNFRPLSESAVMRNLGIAVMAALVFLGGCNSADNNEHAPSGQAVAPAIAPGTTITGTVTFRDQIPINAGAKLDVRLVDIAQPEIAIAEKTFDVGGAPPFNFALDFDPSKIAATRTYVINAQLTDGPRHFVPALNSPVLTHGSGITTQVVLNAEATPAEKLKEDFGTLQAHIGGMKKVAGTFTTDNASVGWDAFAEGGAVCFVRINTDMDAGGRSGVKYAFKDGKPMVVKQTGGATVGWGDNGEVLWNEKTGGGQVGDAEISSLRDAAMKALQMAQDKVDASKKK
jgi:putative lipoprotein